MHHGPRGHALAAGQISEIKPVPGIAFIGPLPEAFQLKTIYAAGLASKSGAIEAAKTLQAFLAEFPKQLNREDTGGNREFLSANREFHQQQFFRSR